ncbi:hypothetical protein QP028_01380 [Corynebacterium suedekumii]|nr:hypothetical protein QP028_01380 [Corynebacterium suedekumii]
MLQRAADQVVESTVADFVGPRVAELDVDPDSHPLDLGATDLRLAQFLAVSGLGRPVLLLDEPDVGLDPQGRGRLHQLIAEQLRDGVAIMMTCHDTSFHGGGRRLRGGGAPHPVPTTGLRADHRVRLAYCEPMTRIHGLDLARAVAIIGMMVAHIGPESFITEGYPSVLFAVLAGVSMGIITANSASVWDARFRLLVRAVLLLAIGLLLAAVQSGILVVLTAIGAAYLLLLPVLRWRTRSLLILLAGLVVLGPLLIAAQTVLWLPWANAAFADLIFGAYPLTAWTTYVLVGLLIHRLALHRQVWLLGVGLGLFALTQFIVEAADFRVSIYDELNFFGAWAQPTPHSGGLLDVLTSAGLSAAVIAACLLACRAGAVVWATYPVRALRCDVVDGVRGARAHHHHRQRHLPQSRRGRRLRLDHV